MVKKIISIAITILVVVWGVLVFMDFYRVNKGEDAKLCLSEETKEYSDGTTYVCTGLGFKYYKYNRTGISVSQEYKPFFFAERQPEDSN